MTKRTLELLLLGAFLILAVSLYVSTASYPESVQGSTANYVRFLAISLAVLCIAEMALCLKKSDGGKKMMVSAVPFRFWSLFISLILYALALEPLGFYIASAVFLPITMWFLGARKKVQICCTTGAVLLFVFLVFEQLLSVPLPERLWFF